MTDISEKAARLVERLRKVANGLWGEDEDAVLEAISFLLDHIESTMPIEEARMVDAIMHYGARCRECADADTPNVCHMSGLPCHPDEARKAIGHVLRARAYYTENPQFLRAREANPND